MLLSFTMNWNILSLILCSADIDNLMTKPILQENAIPRLWRNIPSYWNHTWAERFLKFQEVYAKKVQSWNGLCNKLQRSKGDIGKLQINV